MEVDKVADMVVNEVADTLTHYGSVICQAFIQKLALWLYWYWVLGIGLPGYTNYYMVDIWPMPRPNRLIYTYVWIIQDGDIPICQF